jgi:hypothetical protein
LAFLVCLRRRSGGNGGRFPGIGKAIIHEHEELAEKLAIVLYLLGAISVLGIILNIKNHAKANYFCEQQLLLQFQQFMCPYW